MMYIINALMSMDVVQYNEYLLSVVDANGLVLEYWASVATIMDYPVICFQMFIG